MKKSLLTPLLMIVLLSPGCKHQVYQWRGTDRNGIYQETGLPDLWPEEGPDLRWVYEGIGRGFAAPVVTKKGIFVNGEQEGKSYLVALDLEGNLLWKSPNGDEFLGEGFSSTYPGARSTPTVVGNLVYATSGKGRIACFKVSTGAEKWAVSITDNLDGELGYFGYSESVAVDDKHVYCYPGGSATNVAALDRFTGEKIWTGSMLRDTFAYGSPVLVDLPARKMMIHTSWHHIFTADLSSGELLGSYLLEGHIVDGEHCNTPVFDDKFIYFVGNDESGQGAVKLELSPDGKNIREVWRNSAIRNNFGGLVVINNHLFTMVKGNRLVSLNPETGEVTDAVEAATGSLAYADSKFFCYGNNGTLNLVTLNNNQLKVTGTLKITQGTGQHFSHPVIADGSMYIRHGNALMAYQLK